jgi:hypothetical protein
LIETRLFAGAGNVGTLGWTPRQFLRRVAAALATPNCSRDARNASAGGDPSTRPHRALRLHARRRPVARWAFGTGGDRLLPASRLGPSGLPMPGSGRLKKGTGGSQGRAAYPRSHSNPNSESRFATVFRIVAQQPHQRVLPHTRQLCGSFAVVGRFCTIGVSPGSHRGPKIRF